MAISIDDVARAAGVSTATVSRALRGLPNVTPQTRQAVEDIARRLGYVPSRNASGLAGGWTRTVGLVAPAISRWFFATAFEGAEHALRAAGFDALLYSLPDTAVPRTRFDPDVLRRRVDAVLVASLHFDQAETDGLRSLGLPAVFVSVHQPGFAFVGIDDDDAAVQATRHLIDLGHRVIGHIGGRRDGQAPFSPTTRRRAGWQRTVVEAGLDGGPELDAEADFTPEAGRAAAWELMDRRPDLTGVVVGSDELAFGVIEAARQRGRQPGRDLSIIGIDGHNLSGIMGLTTVAQPAYDQGAAAADLLLEALRDGPDVADDAGAAALDSSSAVVGKASVVGINNGPAVGSDTDGVSSEPGAEVDINTDTGPDVVGRQIVFPTRLIQRASTGPPGG